MKMKLVLCVLLLSASAYLAAQEGQDKQKRAPVFDMDALQLEQSNEQLIQGQQLIEQVFEKEINPDEYIVGPGDQLLVKVWGAMEKQIPVLVSPEGYVIIPAVSEIFVSGKTLTESIRLITNELGQTFQNARFTVRLIKMRKFRVFVVGEIQNPGTYFLRTVDRLSDAIQLAQGLTNWGDDTRVELRRENGEVSVINLTDFYLTGNLDNNPMLSGGDVIFIPSIDLQGNYAIIEGNVGSQGIYQLRKQESLFDFLTRLRALNRRSNLENIILFRDGEKSSYSLLSRDSEAFSVQLKSGDRIMVPTIRNQVYVRGEVAQPGAFPYLADYSALDYAGLAGVMETAKGLNRIQVIRLKTGEIEQGKDVVVENGDIVVVPRRARENLKDVLTILTPIISIGISAFALVQATK